MWPMGVQTGVPDLTDITAASEVHKWALGKPLADSLQLPSDTLITVMSSPYHSASFHLLDHVIST